MSREKITYLPIFMENRQRGDLSLREGILRMQRLIPECPSKSWAAEVARRKSFWIISTGKDILAPPGHPRRVHHFSSKLRLETMEFSRNSESSSKSKRWHEYCVLEGGFLPPLCDNQTQIRTTIGIQVPDSGKGRYRIRNNSVVISRAQAPLEWTLRGDGFDAQPKSIGTIKWLSPSSGDAMAQA